MNGSQGHYTKAVLIAKTRGRDNALHSDRVNNDMPRKFDKIEWQLIRHGARWMPSEEEAYDGQFGNCYSWAIAHQKAYPHLNIGAHWAYDTPYHFFTHDDRFAYDTNGVHELPYTFINQKEEVEKDDPADEVEGREYGTAYNLSDGIQYQPKKQKDDIALSELIQDWHDFGLFGDRLREEPSKDWILKYAPNPNRPPDVSTPNESTTGL